MKIRQDKTKNSIIFYLLVIAVDLIYWFGFVGPHLDVDFMHYVIIGVWTIPAVTLYTICLIRSQVILNEKEMIQKQPFRELHIPYDDIVYIDKERALHSKNIFLVHKNKYPIVITMDKKKVLLEELLKRCHHLRPVEELEKEGYFAFEENYKNSKGR
jgi:hypothetical protein